MEKAPNEDEAASLFNISKPISLPGKMGKQSKSKSQFTPKKSTSQAKRLKEESDSIVEIENVDHDCRSEQDGLTDKRDDCHSEHGSKNNKLNVNTLCPDADNRSARSSNSSRKGPPTKKGGLSCITYDERAKRLLDMIDKKIGPSSKHDFPFNFPKLEKQALKYLKLEDEEALSQNKNRI